MSISASFQADRAVGGLRDVLAAIDGLRTGHLTDEELALARETRIARWRHAMSTARGAAALYAAGIAEGRETSRTQECAARVSRVGRDDLVRVAKAYLDPAAIRVIVAGPDPAMDLESLRMGPAVRMQMVKE